MATDAPPPRLAAAAARLRRRRRLLLQGQGDHDPAAATTAPPTAPTRLPQTLLLLVVLLLAASAAVATASASAASPHSYASSSSSRVRAAAATPGFLPPASWSRAAAGSAHHGSSSRSSQRREAGVVWGRKKKPPMQPRNSGGSSGDEEEDKELLSILEELGGARGGKKAPRKKKAAAQPRAPVFTARIVLLGAPSPDWAAGVRARLLEEGWMADRVQVLPLPTPEDYSEAKWIAYMREGIKLRNATFVIAGGPGDSGPGAPSAASAQVLRFLEKYPLRGAILFAPPDQYALGGETDGTARVWDYGAVRRHCPFVGLVYPLPPDAADSDGWSPPPEAEAVREGLGLAPYPFGIRGPAPGQEHKAIEALIRDWQFLESLGMGPIQLVGEDDEEEAAAAAAAAAAAVGEGRAGGNE